jgi:hypothetical protein
MHRLGFPDLVILATIALIIYSARRPKNPPRFPRHPVPGFEPLSLLAQRIRRKVDSWHF